MVPLRKTPLITMRSKLHARNAPKMNPLVIDLFRKCDDSAPKNVGKIQIRVEMKSSPR